MLSASVLTSAIEATLHHKNDNCEIYFESSNAQESFFPFTPDNLGCGR